MNLEEKERTADILSLSAWLWIGLNIAGEYEFTLRWAIDGLVFDEPLLKIIYPFIFWCVAYIMTGKLKIIPFR